MSLSVPNVIAGFVRPIGAPGYAGRENLKIGKCKYFKILTCDFDLSVIEISIDGGREFSKYFYNSFFSGDELDIVIRLNFPYSLYGIAIACAVYYAIGQDVGINESDTYLANRPQIANGPGNPNNGLYFSINGAGTSVTSVDLVCALSDPLYAALSLSVSFDCSIAGAALLEIKEDGYNDVRYDIAKWNLAAGARVTYSDQLPKRYSMSGWNGFGAGGIPHPPTAIRARLVFYAGASGYVNYFQGTLSLG